MWLLYRKPLFVVEYRKSIDNSHEKVQGNLMLVWEKGAFPLRSPEIDNAVSQIENSPMTNSQPVQPTLFD